ncbi:hypothetical protein ILT44_23310 [Microvirga sp. BT689]|uniref:hypothetical protein n=1 Tax=Microvirga arvi TaxID=2778731 RepID=UPI001950445D|nr:hypothetical protein [Microvirga arvi]MBM6583134.1 hypothetical protein [Microvirga arvi]
MDELRISENSYKGWQDYAERIGFVPDPMILRSGEIFLNGLSGVDRLQRVDRQVGAALKDNIGSLVEFFDLVVTRDTIPLIDYYGHTFDSDTVPRSLESFLGPRLCNVTIDYQVYRTIKAGALRSLTRLEFDRLTPLAGQLFELDALRYDWHPELRAGDQQTDEEREKLAKLDEPLRLVAQFLLGGFIFSGFAQASETTHYIQPKRSRLMLGLTVAPETTPSVGREEEAAIFKHAEASLEGSKANVVMQRSIPPVLPYLISGRGAPKTTLELLDKAKEFRDSPDGIRYREAVQAIRGGGIEGDRTSDLSAVERARALEMLAPYSNLDTERSRSLEVKFKLDARNGLSVELPIAVQVPAWLRVWWNDNIVFGGMRKTFRRMWMSAESYNDVAGKMLEIWKAS